MGNFLTIIAIITLVSCILLISIMKKLDSKKINPDDPKYKTNSPFNIFVTVLIIVVVVGFLILSMSTCESSLDRPPTYRGRP